MKSYLLGGIAVIGLIAVVVIGRPNLAPAPVPEPENRITVGLGEQFTLKKNQVAVVAETGLEIRILHFYNSPCGGGMQCFWSGVGILIEYRLNGQVQSGIGLAEAFGHRTRVVKSDFESYADLIVQRIPAEQ